MGRLCRDPNTSSPSNSRWNWQWPYRRTAGGRSAWARRGRWRKRAAPAVLLVTTLSDSRHAADDPAHVTANQLFSALWVVNMNSTDVLLVHPGLLGAFFLMDLRLKALTHVWLGTTDCLELRDQLWDCRTSILYRLRAKPNQPNQLLLARVTILSY